MDATTFADTLQKLYIYVFAAALAIARVTPIVVMVPIFTRLGLSGILQGGVALALGFPMIPIIVAALGPGLPPLAQMASILVKEPVIGVTIGLVLGIPFWAAEAAGDILDFQRASAFAGLADPTFATEQSITGTLLSVAMVGLFFASGGLDTALRVFYGSYGIWPATQIAPVFGAGAGLLMVGILDDVFRLGVMLVVPIMVSLLISDVLLALLARAAPNMHVFDLSLSVKSLVLTVLLVIYAVFLAGYMADTLRRIPEAPTLLERLAGKGGAQ